MKIKLTDKHGKVLDTFTISAGAPNRPHEIIVKPGLDIGVFVLAQQGDEDGANVYRPARSILELQQ